MCGRIGERPAAGTASAQESVRSAEERNSPGASNERRLLNGGRYTNYAPAINYRRAPLIQKHFFAEAFTLSVAATQLSR